jgi:endonuclease YncB( thermonuclease family)
VAFGYVVLLALVAAVALDRSGRFGYRGDDWARFNQRAARAVEILDGDTFVASVPGSDDRVTVRLLGVDAPDPPSQHWSEQATKYLTARLANRSVTLRLEGTQTRDADGHLLAYVYVTDGDCLNADIVRDGQAYSDRRVKHSLRSPLEQAERDARAKGRGLWQDVTDDQQPEWRREWLRSLPKAASRHTLTDRSKSE